MRTAVDVEEDRLKEETKLARKLKLTPMTALQREVCRGLPPMLQGVGQRSVEWCVVWTSPIINGTQHLSADAKRRDKVSPPMGR